MLIVPRAWPLALTPISAGGLFNAARSVFPTPVAGAAGLVGGLLVGVFVAFLLHTKVSRTGAHVAVRRWFRTQSISATGLQLRLRYRNTASEVFLETDDGRRLHVASAATPGGAHRIMARVAEVLEIEAPRLPERRPFAKALLVIPALFATLLLGSVAYAVWLSPTVLSVTCVPRCELEIEGEAVGMVGPRANERIKREVAPGEHRLRATHDSEATEFSVAVGEQQHRRVVVDFRARAIRVQTVGVGEDPPIEMGPVQRAVN